mgnify:CR=1 FL=1
MDELAGNSRENSRENSRILEASFNSNSSNKSVSGSIIKQLFVTKVVIHNKCRICRKESKGRQELRTTLTLRASVSEISNWEEQCIDCQEIFQQGNILFRSPKILILHIREASEKKEDEIIEEFSPYNGDQTPKHIYQLHSAILYHSYVISGHYSR